jgi:hypothetical protein
MAVGTALAQQLMLADNLENFGQRITATALSATGHEHGWRAATAAS